MPEASAGNRRAAPSKTSVEIFVAKWDLSAGAEHSNSQSFLNDLCDVLGVARPQPATGDPAKDNYVFEKPVLLANEENASIGHVDLFKEGHFILEAKQGSNIGTKRIGTARRGTPAWNIAMRDAYGQALGYAKTLNDPPPFIITTDVGYCIELYASFDGTGHYRAFPNAQTNRVYLKALLEPTTGPKHLDILWTVFTDPLSLDPSRHATKVTREVAAHLAELARVLEKAGEPSERVARFLMRAIFTMFAEDVGLLPEGLFARLIDEHWLPNPPAFPGGIRSLWKAMNDGGDYFVKLLKFNGGLFKDCDAPSLKAEHLLLLQEAARCDWSEVEPAIFGTLLERALDPYERHRLGAHYTPRAYVERLVRPTIEEPMRGEWDLVRGEVRQLVEAGKEAAAKKAVRAFYDRLTHTRVLDPACGTGNFLYVTLDLFKRLEAEVVALLSDLEESQTIGEVAGYGVTPQQFLGIEVKPWAKEIAELVLWIGYLQWHFRTRGRVNPPEPVLRDFGNIQLRDAVLAFDRQELVRDGLGRPVTRWDGRTFKLSPITGKEVPDEGAMAPTYKYEHPRPAEWPKCDFIVGNPPYIGNKRMRLALGDGYVEALRAAHDDVPDTSDLVMYWWNHAARLVREGKVRRFGLITTNSITQTAARPVVDGNLRKGLSLAFAVADHPWVDAEDGAAVRVAMSCGAAGDGPGALCRVVTEKPGEDGEVLCTLESQVGRINPDFSVGSDVSSAVPLRGNASICFQGYILVGKGFCVSEADLRSLGVSVGRLPAVVRPWKNGKDLLREPSNRFVIDFFGLTEAEARSRFPALFQHALLTVKPLRDQVARKGHREKWWIWGEARPGLRQAIRGLSRIIVTNFAAKHRVFVFEDPKTAIDHNMYVVAVDDPLVLGVLSSRVHITWMLAAGSTLEDRPLWVSGTCFDPFPFPKASNAAARRIRALAEDLDAHRKKQQQEHPALTITAMYNVLTKLRSGAPLSGTDKAVHDQGLVSVLRQLHDDLDDAVLAAYGWPRDISDQHILDRLVMLNTSVAAQERSGTVRWLRPQLQNPEGDSRAAVQAELLDVEDARSHQKVETAMWPKKLHERIAAVREALADGGASWTVVEVAKVFKGAKRAEVEEVLQGLAALGLAVSFVASGVRRWRATGNLAA